MLDPFSRAALRELFAERLTEEKPYVWRTQLADALSNRSTRPLVDDILDIFCPPDDAPEADHVQQP